MRRPKHDPKNPTIRDAFERYVLPDARFANSTINNHWSMIARWEKLAGNPRVKSIHYDTIVAFRAKCEAEGYANDSTEGGIRTVMRCLRACRAHRIIRDVSDSGRPLTLRQTPRAFPTLAELGKLYDAAKVAEWPTLTTSPKFWHAVFAVVFFTGLRRADLFYRLTWDMVTEDRITINAGKTGKLHVFPMHPVLRRHLNLVRDLKGGDGRVFPIGNCNHQILREMKRMSKAAGVPPITLQSIRRLSATNWQATKWGAGEIIQGAALRSSAKLYVVPQLLEQAAPLLLWPEAMLTAAERDLRKKQERILMDRFRKLGDDDRGVVMRLIEGLGV